MKRLLLLACALLLGGCNYVNSVTGLSKDSDKAIGAACRQTGRSLEACYQRNPNADKAFIYAGWREMNEYMAKNKLDTMEPLPEAAPAASAPAPAMAGKHAASGASSSAKQAGMPDLMSSEDADRAAKNDPQVEAVLKAIRSGQHSKSSSAPPAGEDQKRLLNIIQELNKSDSGHNPG
ncbi:hypothetical protein DK842_21875 [Chromobacterium phragmitis]|uniref:Uncharacterized protein n=1 Tax=Chromobacterium phragmitis TaxID=2202141 RepID=A0A344UEH1_9NEIS|nr:hypothetical protein [Chromobacterium phragmitis]AXE32329.1 hypothetical protein DK842_21875 [Chromobacterium phragmitis]AXE33669.1 hypothetical protein DK843_04615 [Chromobacterium phragmitis]